MKKVLTYALSLVVVIALTIAGTIAYLTDKDSETNVFTVGEVNIELNETFKQGSQLVPGKPIDKVATITNTGKNDAWVWMTIAVPTALKDVITLTPTIDVQVWTKEEGTTTIDNMGYTVYTLLHNTVVKPGETTKKGLEKVTLNSNIDIKEGIWYSINGGQLSEPIWNSNENPTPTIYVNAYAIQNYGFETVQNAYAAYQTQWGNNGSDYNVPKNVKTNEALDDAIKAGNNTLILNDGNYAIPTSAQGKTLTIIGDGNSSVAVNNPGSYEGCDYSLQGSNVTFKNVVINTNSTPYTGYAGLSATYENCTFNGTYNLYGDSTFINCTFNIEGDAYNLWTWAAENVTFENCTFNSDGKALFLYGGAKTKLTVNNCTFIDNGGLVDEYKAAIEIGNDYNTSYELIVNNATVNGFAINNKGINTGTTLWGNKNSMGTDKLNVIVDDVDVY